MRLSIAPNRAAPSSGLCTVKICNTGRQCIRPGNVYRTYPSLICRAETKPDCPGTDMASASRQPHSQQQKQSSPWGVRAAVAALAISLLVSVPWEKLDHSFPYEDLDVPDVGAQDKPRWVEAASHV
jgi:hypothetical protein